jgi:predicted PhzF superfamily epimerase YddE/YHI9
MKQYIVDAFTQEVFKGNPAAVCILDTWLSDTHLQAIALENNLSETAFVVKKEEQYHLRWFSLNGEIDLCGHATLAAAYVIANFYEHAAELTFHTMSGDITVSQQEERFEISFHSFDLEEIAITDEPIAVYRGRDLLCVLDTAEAVYCVTPDQEKIAALDGLLLHVTAKSEGEYTCVSRTFAPKLNIAEDPVCGSGHCHIVPYWAKRLQTEIVIAYQASTRGGILYGTYMGDRTKLAGYASLFAIADIFIS